MQKLFKYWPVASIYALSVIFALIWVNVVRHVSLFHALEGFMVAFLTLFALLKMRDVPGFATRFASYDLIAKRFKPYGFVYPFIELGLALLYAFGALLVFADWFVVGLAVIGIVSVYRSIIKKERLYCACLGTTFDLPLSYVAIFENVTMFVMGLAMIGLGHS
jgi:hypothetical protein